MLHEALGPVLFGQARRLQQEHERIGAAIHDGHFGGGEFHDAVVHAQAGQRRHQVLDRGDARAILAQHGAQARVAHLRGDARGISTAGERSLRRNTMPVSAGAGCSVMSMRVPLCRPTPEALMRFLSVRWPNIVFAGSATVAGEDGYRSTSTLQGKQPAAARHSAAAGRRFPAGFTPAPGKAHARTRGVCQSAWRRRNAGISSSSSFTCAGAMPSPTARA